MYAIAFIGLGFVLMELSGWFIHKYLMHGPLWGIHKTHHEHSNRLFELNDLFSLFFGLVAVALIVSGIANMDYRLWMGVGISLYGFGYFFFHDVVIHRRLKIFKRPSRGYLAGIFKAHQAHHASKGKDDSVSFGLFIVSSKYFKKEKR